MNLPTEFWPIFINTVIVLIVVYAYAYLTRKGQNVATKEDIRELTAKVESIKHDYARDLERIRVSFGSQLHVYQLRYEKELEILEELAEKLVDLRDAAQNLRPTVDFNRPHRDENQIKNERLAAYQKALQSLHLTSEKKRPFFPEELYQTVQKFRDKTWNEAIEAWAGQKPEDFDFWTRAVENSKEIIASAEETLQAIRERAKYWETLELRLIEIDKTAI